MLNCQGATHTSPSITLTLNTPEAKESLSRAYALLLRWAREAREREAADSDCLTGTAPSAASDLDQHQTDCSSPAELGQGGAE